MRLRRAVYGASVAGIAAMAVVGFYQLGAVRHLALTLPEAYRAIRSGRG